MLDLFTEDGEESLFGSTLPEGYVPLGRVGSALIGDVDQLVRWADAEPTEDPKRTKSATATATFNYRSVYDNAVRSMKKLYPGKYWSVDYKEISFSKWRHGRPDFASAQIVSKDMLGFADVAGVSKSRFVALQITTRGQIHAHLRKYVDDDATHGQAKTPIETHLREFLECGGIFLVLGFYKDPGSRFWKHELVEVSPALLDLYKARKRGPRKAK